MFLFWFLVTCVFKSGENVKWDKTDSIKQSQGRG